MWKIFLQGQILSTTGDALLRWRCCGTPQVTDRDVTCWISDQMASFNKEFPSYTVYVQAMSRSHLLDLLLWAVFVLRLTWTSNLHKQAWWPHKADLMQPFSHKWGIHGLQIWTQDLENVCDAHQFMWPSGLDLSSIWGQKCMSYVCYCKVAACN